jgi:hypothetical protein
VTTIAYRRGVLAADSLACTETQKSLCQKLYRRIVTIGGLSQEVIIATAGESSPGLRFLDWYCGERESTPEIFVTGDAEFNVLVLTRDGLFEYDAWCRGEKIIDDVYAIGSGAAAAMGAMRAGASAKRAVQIACTIDPYTGPPVLSMYLKPLRSKPAHKPKEPKADRDKGNDSRKDVGDAGDKL